MDDDSPLARARENATSIVSTLVTGIWLAAMFAGQDWWLAAMLFGYVVVVPITAMLFGPDEDEAEAAADAERSRTAGDAMAPPWEGGEESADAGSAERETALERLRRRYAEGELTDEQFERKLERLLETETLEDVEEREWARERSEDDHRESSEPVSGSEATRERARDRAGVSEAPGDDDREPEPERS